VSNKFDSLYWVYDAGFRWGPPDLTYPDPLRPEGSRLGVHKIEPTESAKWERLRLTHQTLPTCEVPGCYVCKRDRDGRIIYRPF
jgi:hypothetical protein